MKMNNGKQSQHPSRSPSECLNKYIFETDILILKSSKNFIDTVKTIDLTRLRIQITKYSSFSNHTHQTYKEIQIEKHVNSKPKVLKKHHVSYPTVSDYGQSSENRPTRSIIRHQNCFS